jgi:hypothetical protein
MEDCCRITGCMTTKFVYLSGLGRPIPTWLPRGGRSPAYGQVMTAGSTFRLARGPFSSLRRVRSYRARFASFRRSSRRRAKVAQLRGRLSEVESDARLRDIEEATVRRRAELRQAIVGDARDTAESADSVASVRAALARLDRFVLHCFDEGAQQRSTSAPPGYFEPDLLRPGYGGLYLEPLVKPEAVEDPAPDGFEEIIFPVLRRLPISLDRLGVLIRCHGSL